MSQTLASAIDIDAVVRAVVAELGGLHASKTNAPAFSAPAAPVPQNTPLASPLGDGVFATVNEAVAAAKKSQEALVEKGLEARLSVEEAIKNHCTQYAEELGKLELDETRIGRLPDKIQKLRIIRKILGVAAFRQEARSDGTGVDIVSAAPWGVLGMVTPMTHSVPTLAANAITAVAAGNAAVFCPHPSASRCFAAALARFNRAIAKAIGIPHLLTMVNKPTIESTEEVFRHRDISLICVTGGPAVVRTAMRTGKRVIAAGPGNPPAVVDEGADYAKAARDILAGAAFDNNLLCLGEKEVFAVGAAFRPFMDELERAGAFCLTAQQVERLTDAVMMPVDAKGHVLPKKEFVGADAYLIARAAGINVPAQVPLLFGPATADHPFVVAEQMMPFLPIVHAPDIDSAIEMAAKAEHGFRHTAIIHTSNLEHASRMSRRMNTTLFLVNASSVASLGEGGPGYLNFSIATPTGEGVITPQTLTRQRQVVIGDVRFV